MPRVEFNEVEEAQDYSPVPTGVYLCRLTAIDDRKTTQAGDEMWDLKFTVEEGDYAGRSIFDRISFGKAALPRVKLLCSRMGLDVSGPLNVTPDLIRGRRVFVSAEVEDYVDKEGKERQRNNIPFAGFMAVTEPEPEPKEEDLETAKARVGGPHPPNLSEPDDDLPF